MYYVAQNHIRNRQFHMRAIVKSMKVFNQFNSNNNSGQHSSNKTTVAHLKQKN